MKFEFQPVWLQSPDAVRPALPPVPSLLPSLWAMLTTSGFQPTCNQAAPVPGQPRRRGVIAVNARAYTLSGDRTHEPGQFVCDTQSNEKMLCRFVL